MKTETNVRLITDVHDLEISKVFYAEKLKKLKGKKVEWGVYAENFDSDSPALVAVVSGPSAAQEALNMASVLELAIQRLANERGKRIVVLLRRNS